MQRHRPIMNALRSQIRHLEGNPGLPGGVLPPSVAWLEANCTISQHDYGNGNVQFNYVCEHIGSGNRAYRCTWSRWSNSNTVQLVNCVEITRAHYHDTHGSGEGPQSKGTPSTPPWQPYDRGRGYDTLGIRNPISMPQRIRDAVWQGAHEITHVMTRHAGNPEGPYTPVCPTGQEPCGNTTSGGVLCCDIPIKGPTPAGAGHEPPPRLVYGHTQTRLTLRQRLARFFRI